MRVVFDTNVLLSAFNTRGVCEALVQKCFDRSDISHWTSEFILAEFAEHDVGKFGSSKDQARESVAWIRSFSTLVQPATIKEPKSLDPDDIPVLGTALAAKAHVLVTGDQELLRLEKFEGTAIVTPRALLQALV